MGPTFPTLGEPGARKISRGDQNLPLVPPGRMVGWRQGQRAGLGQGSPFCSAHREETSLVSP